MSIKIEDLTYKYLLGTTFETIAIDNISFEMNDGEIVGVVGNNSSGKSTLVLLINGMLKPTRGKVYVDGVSVIENKSELANIRKKIGVVFQYPEYHLFQETVYKDIAFGAQYSGFSDECILKSVKYSMQLVDLRYEEYKEKCPFELSRGEMRRVAIAGALIMKPKVLILDEPTVGLDPKEKRDILEQIKKLYEKEKISIIFVSHSIEEIAEFADRLIVLDKGKIILNGTPKEILKEVEIIEEVGVVVPQATYLMRELRKRGIDVRDDIMIMQQAISEILRVLIGDDKL